MKTKVLLTVFLVMITLNFISSQSTSEMIIVTGKITDFNEKPIKDVIYLVDNINYKIKINKDGSYKIKIPNNTKLISVFTFNNEQEDFEYNGEEIVNFKFLNKTDNFKLIEESLQKEKIDVGFGTAEKDKITTSIGVVDTKKRDTYKDIYEMIASKVSGVTVNGKNVVIRGQTSLLSSNPPLFVVDGVVASSIDNINPSDVDNISVLKGVSAAKYGSSGANGVILINTIDLKKGN